MQNKTKTCMFQVRLKQGDNPDVLYGPIPDHLLNLIFLAYMPNFIESTKYNVVIFIIDPRNKLLRLFRINSQDIAVRRAMMDPEEVKQILMGENR